MDIKTRLTRCCGKDMGSGLICHDGMRCPDCFDKLEGLRTIEELWDAIAEIKKHMRQADRYGLKESTQQILDNVKDE